MRGYDYELELSYWESGGIRYLLGSAGSMILVCPKCGEEHFRHDISVPENCFTCKTRMEPFTIDNRDKMIAIWAERGDKITSVEERREERIAREAKRDAALRLTA